MNVTCRCIYPSFLFLISYLINIICIGSSNRPYWKKVNFSHLRSWKCRIIKLWRESKRIGLSTPINYFGRYATCSHKDGGRSHIQSRETIAQEDHVTCLKLRPRVNFSPAFGAYYKTRIFYKHVVFKHPSSLLHKFFAAATHSLLRESTGERSNNMDGPRRHSKYTLTMRRFPVSEKLPVSNHKKGHFKYVILL